MNIRGCLNVSHILREVSLTLLHLILMTNEKTN